jgi:predicted amidohydrolase
MGQIAADSMKVARLHVPLKKDLTRKHRMDELKLLLVQPDMVWEDPESNLAMLEDMIAPAAAKSDLVILPETFSTGFTMHVEEYAEGEKDRTVEWMKAMANQHGIHLAGSLIFREEGRIFNRMFWISPGGIEGMYDKRHLFRMGREDTYFQSGTERKVFLLGEFRFMPQICYDLRFPVFARNRGDYDVLFYVANWPEPRHTVWEVLLRARAIENQAYVIGVSRSGTDGEGVSHLGGSCVIDPMGRVEAILDHRPGILEHTLGLKKIREFREKFPVWKDADQFKLD